MSIHDDPMINLCAVAAMADNRVIGRDNKLPWQLRDDLLFFRMVTSSRPMIIGRKTFESFGSKALPGRPCVVLSASLYVSSRPTPPNVVYAPTGRAALLVANELASNLGSAKIVVAGGAMIYEHFLPLCNELMLTHVAGSVAGDTMFPAFEAGEFAADELANVRATDRNSHDFRIVHYRRRRQVVLGPIAR